MKRIFEKEKQYNLYKVNKKMSKIYSKIFTLNKKIEMLEARKTININKLYEKISEAELYMIKHNTLNILLCYHFKELYILMNQYIIDTKINQKAEDVRLLINSMLDYERFKPIHIDKQFDLILPDSKYKAKKY